MKNKTSLVLMELTVMVLIFALAAAGCLRCFAWAKLSSREITLRDQAAVLAANAAELLKSGEDPEAALEVPDGLLLTVTTLSPEIPGLAEAQIDVLSEEGTKLLTLTAAWQEDTQ